MPRRFNYKGHQWVVEAGASPSHKTLLRSAVAQAFAGPVVQVIHRIIDLMLSDFQQVGLLGKELAQQTIVVLVEPADAAPAPQVFDRLW